MRKKLGDKTAESFVGLYGSECIGRLAQRPYPEQSGIHVLRPGTAATTDSNVPFEPSARGKHRTRHDADALQ